MKRERGFTLIEVMISLAIMAIISLAIYNNTTQSFVLRENLETEGDFYNGVRVALDVMGRDIMHLYSPQPAALPGKLGQVGNQQSQTGAAGAAPPALPQSQQPLGTPLDFWSEPLNVQGVRLSRFQGEGTKISFISNGHMRLFRDAQESDFAKITYQIENDTQIEMGRPTAKILTKTEDTTVFDDLVKSSTATRFVLLHGIKSLAFEFLDGEKDTYDSRWDTTSQNHPRVFPAVIKVTIEVFVPKTDNALKVTQLYKPEMAP